jgi:RHS repeat-associated protein
VGLDKPFSTFEEDLAMRLRRKPLSLLCSLSVALIGLAALQPARAQSSPPVSAYYGAMGTEVPIELPSFHGLEPAIKLTYSSTSGDGMVGVGWSISGFSSIQRTQPGHGTPLYNSSDIYVFDGQDLVPDTSMGGGYSTRIKNYTRIVFNSSSNTWTVTGTNGNVATLSPVYTTSLGTLSWGLTSVTDPKGNTVSFGWWCDGSPALQCYPSTVSYNGTAVTLYRGSRPDPISFANGSGTLGQTNYLLKSIDVQVGGGRARSYALGYRTSPGSGRSLLATVTQYGRDATVDSSGNVTAGSSLPATKYSYTAPTPAWSASNLPVSQGFAVTTTNPAPTASGSTGGGKLVGLAASANTITGTCEYDGGYTVSTDTCGSLTFSGTVASGNVGGGKLVGLAASGNTITATCEYDGSYSAYTDTCGSLTLSGAVASGNVGGGKLIGLAASGNTITGTCQYDGSYSAYTDTCGTITLSPGTTTTDATLLSGDFNGDGKSDVIAYNNNSANLPVCLSTGTGWSCSNLPATYTGFGSGSGQQTGNGGSGIYAGTPAVGDFNGDGKADVLMFNGAWQSIPVCLSTGTGWSCSNLPATYTGFGSGSGQQTGNGGSGVYGGTPMVGDFNGDGLTDVMMYSSSWQSIPVCLSTGTGWSCSNLPATYAGFGTQGGPGNSGRGIYSGGTPLVGDFNGDGLTDVLQYNSGWGSIPVCLSTGTGWSCSNLMATYTGFGTQGGPGNSGYGIYSGGTPLVGDFNGDGKADLFQYNSSGWGSIPVCLSTGTGWSCSNLMATYTGFGTQGGPGNSGYGIYSGGTPLIGDFNGDGLTDLLQYNSSGWGSIPVCQSTGTGWSCSNLMATYTGFGNSGGAGNAGYGVYSGGTALTADFNGDGKVDILQYNPSWGSIPVVLSDGGPGDLVSMLTNGLGGSTTVAYQPSSAWSNTFLPLGMVFETVASTTTSDAHSGASSTIAYSYQGGLWSTTERRYLGFRYVKSVIDAVGDYAETYYHQHVGCISKPESTYLRDANGNIYHYETLSYTENSAAPYTSLLTTRWDYECDQGSACRRVLHQYGYDAYANVDLEVDWGDYDVSGDESTKVRAYAPNTSSNLTGLPSYENVYAGIGGVLCSSSSDCGGGTCGSGGTCSLGTLVKQTLFSYDGASSYTTPPRRGELTTQQEYNDQTGGYQTRTFAYDASGNRTSWTDPLGSTNTTLFDATYNEFPTQQCNALKQCATQAWDPVLGVSTSRTDDNGNTTTVTYDAFGRPLVETRPDGSTLTDSYVSWGDPNKQHIRKALSDGSNDGLWEDTYFDGLQRTWRHVKKGGSQGFFQDTLYSDSAMRPWKRSSWYDSGAGESPAYTVFAYDGQGRLRTQTLPDGSGASTAYTAGKGQAYVTQTDELGHQKVTWTDGNGRLTQTREQNTVGTGCSSSSPCYDYTTFALDARGRVATATDPTGQVTTVTWNALNEKTAACDPDRGCQSYTYDAAGNELSRTDAKGQTMTFAYDSLSRPTSKSYPDGTAIAWTYDETNHGAGIGRLTSLTDLQGSESYTYDAMGRATTTTKCVAGSCVTGSESFDAAGRLASDTYPDNEVVSYGYDAAGRLSSVSNYVTSMSYDARGHLLSAALANGTTETYAYDPNRQWLTSANVTGPSSSSPLYTCSYTYDAAARLTAESSTSDSSMNVDFAYDDVNRLTSVSGNQTQSWSYDAGGNITNNSALGPYTYGDSAHPHAVTAAGGNSYTYDANGNLTSGAGRTFVWNFDDQAQSVTAHGATVAFAYDARGNRVSKTGPNGTSLYFGSKATQENGNLVKYYFAGLRMVARQDSGGTYYYHHDHLGSVKLVTNSSGAVVNRLDYAPYGGTLQSSASAATPSADAATAGTDASVSQAASPLPGASDEFGFDGQRTDAETGLVYMNARYYDATLGRMISADSMVPDARNPQAFNRYAFAYNNPVSNTDPTGHVPIVAALVAVVSFVAEYSTAILVVGAVLSVEGMATHNAILSTIGGVLMGVAGGVGGLPALGIGSTTGALLGGGIALAASPISPIPGSVKEAIGYAYAALALGSSAYQAVFQNTPNTLAAASAQADAASGVSPVGQTSDTQQFVHLADDAAGNMSDIGGNGVMGGAPIVAAAGEATSPGLLTRIGSYLGNAARAAYVRAAMELTSIVAGGTNTLHDLLNPFEETTKDLSLEAANLEDAAVLEGKTAAESLVGRAATNVAAQVAPAAAETASSVAPRALLGTLSLGIGTFLTVMFHTNPAY